MDWRAAAGLCRRAAPSPAARAAAAGRSWPSDPERRRGANTAVPARRPGRRSAAHRAGDRGGPRQPAVRPDQSAAAAGRAGRAAAATGDREQARAPTPPVDAAPRRTARTARLAFVNASADSAPPARTGSPPASPYVVQAGNVIPAALITGIRSDLPGQITAQVTENVYDSPTGHPADPAGRELIGDYDSQVAFGQTRVLLVWTRLIMPNGTSIVLERQPGADTQGYAGLEDEVDNHWGSCSRPRCCRRSSASARRPAPATARTISFRRSACGASNSINQTGQQIVQRNLNIQPTLTIRPGFPVRVIVNRDLVLEPYGQRRQAMTKLKLGPLADDKPVKLTRRIAGGRASRSACLRRGARPKPGRLPRSAEADRADAGAVHGDGSGVFEGAAPSRHLGVGSASG